MNVRGMNRCGIMVCIEKLHLHRFTKQQIASANAQIRNAPSRCSSSAAVAPKVNVSMCSARPWVIVQLPCRACVRRGGAAQRVRPVLLHVARRGARWDRAALLQLALRQSARAKVAHRKSTSK
jgi:hypothetical protein